MKSLNQIHQQLKKGSPALCAGKVAIERKDVRFGDYRFKNIYSIPTC